MTPLREISRCLAVAAALLTAHSLGKWNGSRESKAAATVVERGALHTIIHFAPAENLERVDVDLIANASERIDMAAYVLTDVAVIEALRARAIRGVKVRLYLHGDQLPRGGAPAAALEALRATPGVETRIKRDGALMHLKSYQFDDMVLRTGSANFSASGLKKQDNDLVVVASSAAAKAFRANFEAIWASGEGAER